ncbi:MAG: DUF5329 domain-containing protein [Burkholderiales bacterium]
MASARTWLLALVAALFPGLATSADPGMRTEAEIAHLMAHLRASGCQFNRNGTWHDAARAVEHIRSKYDYLKKRDLVPTAEAFIERAASASSMSGKPYLVKCGGAPAVESASWLREALANHRRTLQ